MGKKQNKILTECVSNSEAEEICLRYKFGSVDDWRPELKSVNKGKKVEPATEYSCGCGLSDEYGVAHKGLRVLFQVLESKKIELTRTKGTLFLRDQNTKVEKRVVQIEVRTPLDKGGFNADDWPHLHYGRQVIKFGRDEGRADMTPEETVRYFTKKANIQFDPEVNCDFSEAGFKLT